MRENLSNKDKNKREYNHLLTIHEEGVETKNWKLKNVTFQTGNKM